LNIKLLDTSQTILKFYAFLSTLLALKQSLDIYRAQFRPKQFCHTGRKPNPAKPELKIDDLVKSQN